MLRAIAFILIQALLLMPSAAPSFAGEQSTQQAAPPPEPQKKQEIRTRGIQRSAPAEMAAPAPAMAAPPPPTPRSDGGRPDDTIGGLPGHSQDMPGRQP